MTPIRVGLVVEGHGEFKAAPILFRRIGNEVDPAVSLEVLQPIRRPRSLLVNKPDEHELERAVEFAALKTRPRGGIFVLLDSDDDCPAELAPRLLARAESAGMGLPVSVVLAQREFEGWFLAAAESLRGKRGLAARSVSSPKPARDSRREGVAAPAYAPWRLFGDYRPACAYFDLNRARVAHSFDKCYRELERLFARFRE